MGESDRQTERCRHLIELADEVLETYKTSPVIGGYSSVDAEKASQWRSSALTFLEDLLGASHTYVGEFQSATEQVTRNTIPTQKGKGVLLAVRDDLEAGYLTSVRRLIRAEVFSDFLDMAEHLHENGYHHAAVSLAGAVLEDALRQIAEAHNVKAKPRDDLAALNSKLHQAKAYGPLERKEIGVWTDLRNSADHADWDKVNEARTGEMIRGVTRFLATELTR